MEAPMELDHGTSTEGPWRHPWSFDYELIELRLEPPWNPPMSYPVNYPWNPDGVTFLAKTWRHGYEAPY